MSGLLLEARFAARPDLAEELFEGFELAGFRLDADAPAGNARRDDLVVARASRFDESAQRQLVAAARARWAHEGGERPFRFDLSPPVLDDEAAKRLLDRFASLRSRPRRLPLPRAWLPVWDVRRMVAIGVELYVADDEDATQQLNALAEAYPDFGREQMTVKPRRGWQGYGLPKA